MPSCQHCHKTLGWAVEYCPFCGQTTQPKSHIPPVQPIPLAAPTVDAANTPATSAQVESPPEYPATAAQAITPTTPTAPAERPATRANLRLPLWPVIALVLTIAGAVAAKFLHEYLQRQNITALEPEMLAINPGCFTMGSPTHETGRYLDERPHEVCVQGFQMGKYEVTFDEYDRFAKATGRELPQDEGFGRGRHPVFRVSWQDATDYAAWLSKKTSNHYRLPTEAEWEYAARAGSVTAYFWGNDWAQHCGYVNYADCPDAPQHAAPVGQRKPNGWGLHDILGNVAELTASAYDADYQGMEKNAADVDGPTLRVVRGGAWGQPVSKLRSASRTKAEVDFPHNLMGFRLAGQ